MQGEYVGVVTHKGALFLSFQPFAGAKELGFAKGKKIELNLGDKKIVTLTSLEPLLPQEMTAKVFGQYLPQRKTDKFGRVQSFASNKEDRILARIKE
jgi:hypothetical protein